jgi:hypothetical protein
MTIVPGDLLKLKRGIIAHQVNCVGKFNAGLAKKIARTWPKVRELYMHKFKKDGWTLGNTQIINVGDPGQQLFVANCASQFGVGTEDVQTNYSAVKTCFENLAFQRLTMVPDLPIYVPYGYGCGLGGGDWNVILTIIESIVPDAVAIALAGARRSDSEAFGVRKPPLRGPEAGEAAGPCHLGADLGST